MAGKPLTGVKIYVTGVSDAGERNSFETTSDAAGRYSIPLPKGNYHVGRANWNTPAPKGPSYWLPLQPFDKNANDMPSAKGIVEDLVLRMSGRTQPGNDEESWVSYYGGTVRVTPGRVPQENWMQPDRWRWPDGAKVQVSFEPISKLADGTAAKPLTRVCEPQGANGYIYDVPIALYRVSAALIALDGTRKPMRVGLPEYFSGRAPTEKGEPTIEGFKPSGDLWFPANGTDSTPVLRGTGVYRTTLYVVE